MLLLWSGPTTHSRSQRGLVLSWLGSNQRLKLAVETWNITSLVGKEPDLARETERYRLGIVASPQNTAPVVEPTFSRDVFLRWICPRWEEEGRCRLSHSSLALYPAYWGLPQWIERLLPCIRMGPNCCIQTAVQSCQPLWSLWDRFWNSPLLHTPLLYWGN